MRKTWLYTLAMIAVFGLLLTGCEKSNNPLVTNDLNGPDKTTPPSYAEHQNIWAGRTIDVGDLYVWNTETKLYVQYQLTGDWYLSDCKLGVYETFSDIPNWPERPPTGRLYYKSGPINTQIYEFEIDLNHIVWQYGNNPKDTSSFSVTYCNWVWIVAHCDVYHDLDGDGQYDTGEPTETGFGGDSIPPYENAWWYYFKYHVVAPPEPTPGCTTYTQGGWGAPPHGNNPGMYLHTYFTSKFPTGLTIGSTYTLTLTSAQAITDFLPQGGPPAALTQNYTDPTNKISVLCGQMVALKLNITFWPALLDIEVTCGGDEMTVEEFWDIAEDVFGGSSTAYTPEQINECATSINEMFVGGETP